MSQNGREREEQRHREVVQRYREQRERERALVEQLHREFYRSHPAPPPPEPLTIHYTEMPGPQRGDKYYREWITYRREAGRLLTEGCEGRFVLINGDEVRGVWNTEEDAMAEGYDQFPGQPFLVHQLREREPVLRCITMRLCRG